jgi:glycosyltransferase involved in cell wall biosynthesis
MQLEVFHLLNDTYLSAKFQGRSISWGDVLSSFVRRLVNLTHQDKYDCAIVYGELLPFVPHLLESRMLTLPYVYDLDDAFYLKYKKPGLLSHILGNKIDRVIHQASAVTAGSNVLLEYARVFNSEVRLLPTVVDTVRYRTLDSRKDDRQFTVGWIGSPTTAVYLEIVRVPLEILGKEKSVKLVVVGGKAPRIEGIEIEEHEWREEFEIERINQFDIGIMPLTDDEWARGKCAFKLIQYMACGVPVIGSAVGANLEVVDSNSGFLAATNEEWLVALRRLMNDTGLRLRMGWHARTKIETHYSLDRWADTFSDVIRSVTTRVVR